MDLVTYPPTHDFNEIIANTKVFARAWGEGGQKGTWDSGHLVDFPRDFPRGRNASGAGQGQGKAPPKRGGKDL